MDSRIVRKEIKNEFFTDEQCFIIDSSEQSDKSMSIAIARVEPGVTTVSHLLEGIDERYLIISGHGRVELGDQPPADIRSGDIVFIPAGTKQRITNLGSDDLIFYCVCTPPFDSGKYRSLENL